MEKRVTGIGGIFFKSQDPQKVRAWYEQHLGIPANEYGSIFAWRDKDDPQKEGTTVWNPFKAETKYFAPSQKDFMFNYRVENLTRLLELLKAEGVEQVGEMETYDYGKFAWIMDCEGNKIELWEPIDEPLKEA